MRKEELRQHYKDKRASLDSGFMQSGNSDIIGQLAKHWLAAPTPLSIHLFLPIRKFHEVDLQSVLTHFPHHRFFTSVSNFETHELRHIEISASTHFEQDRWGIPVPVEGTEYTGHFDLILVPLLAIDEQGNRLGYGKGFYDRFLEQHRSAHFCGIGWFRPEEKIAHEVQDVPLNSYIYPQATVYFK